MRIYIYFMIALFMGTVQPLMAKDYLKTFNYYHRNRDGTFILETIVEDNIPVPLFRLSVLYINDNIKSVTGFYYGTNKIKFIDEIAGYFIGSPEAVIKRISIHSYIHSIFKNYMDFGDEIIIPVTIIYSFDKKKERQQLTRYKVKCVEGRESYPWPFYWFIGLG